MAILNQVRIRRNMNHVQAETDLSMPTRNPVYTNRSRDHDCPPLTTVFNLMNADGGIGSAPSATATRSSLPASKDYPCPRLRQTSPLHRTSTRSFQYPVWLGSTVRALCPTCEDACTHTHEIGHTHKHTHAHRQQRARTRKHTRTNAHSHAGREGHSRMRRWVQRHRGDESKGYQRREHQSDDHRPAANANAKQSSGLI